MSLSSSSGLKASRMGRHAKQRPPPRVGCECLGASTEPWLSRCRSPCLRERRSLIACCVASAHFQPCKEQDDGKEVEQAPMHAMVASMCSMTEGADSTEDAVRRRRFSITCSSMYASTVPRSSGPGFGLRHDPRCSGWDVLRQFRVEQRWLTAALSCEVDSDRPSIAADMAQDTPLP